MLHHPRGHTKFFHIYFFDKPIKMNNEHHAIFSSGVANWNDWRKGHYWFTSIDLSDITFKGDLSAIDFRDADLSRVNFRGVTLNNADLRDAILVDANLEMAQLVDCDLRGANLNRVNLRKANLTGARFDVPDRTDKTLKRWDPYPNRQPTKFTSMRSACCVGANLDRIKGEMLDAEGSNFAGSTFRDAIVSEARFRGANLNAATCVRTNFRGTAFDYASLVETDFRKANLCDCSVFGVSAWDIVLADTEQQNIKITREGDCPVVVDNVELAQFMYLLLNNRKVRNFVDTISTKLVLIIGRFSRERKYVLDEARHHIRVAGYIPILVDFEKPRNRDLTETVSTIAHLARLVIADLTDARSVPHELAVTIPNLPSVRFQPICALGEDEYGMFEHFKSMEHVSETLWYDSPQTLARKLTEVLTGLNAEIPLRQLSS